MNSDWLYGLVGGALIGVSASLLSLFGKRAAGVSGILAAALGTFRGEGNRLWRWLFLMGLVAGGAGLRLFAPARLGPPVRDWPWLLIAGLLVGVGTRLSGGCTSGHGVCGLSRLSGRSFVA